MNVQEIRNAYLKFYTDRGHAVVSRASLILQDDPTTLFTGSGMQPHPKGQRLVDSQTCLRAQDIDEVGDNRHTTFFEMIGNWSMGDYFKAEQIPWMYEFLLDVVKLDVNKIYATCFIGDDRFDIPRDTESAALLKKLFADRGVEALEADINTEEEGYERGIKPGERIFFYDGYNNWWWRGKGVAEMIDGEPGGPSSEMFYRFDDSEHTDSEKQAYGEHCHPACDCGRFMEIGNNVFMEYVRRGEGFEKLPKRNVDHGSGLERIAAARKYQDIGGDGDVYRISLLWPIIEKLQDLSGKSYESHTNAMRVIADHLRAATFLAVDGCKPANKEQGYVMRRLLRRAIRFAFDLGVEQNFFEAIVPVIADMYETDFPEVKAARDEVIATLVKEEKVFRQTLRKGLKELDKFKENGLTGAELFTLYDTYGFPVELSTEEAFRQEIKLSENWRAEFDSKMDEQRNRSRTATKGEFKGGLGGDALIHKKYHTATHLLQSALRQIFGPELRQHGSNITEERLRFDFSLDRKVTPEEIAKAEELVNGWIAEDLPVSYKLYPTHEALDMGAIGPFGERYDEQVKVYQMGEGDNIASLEICGGPHVDHTGQLAEGGKTFKITKEEASSAGIRRIKAVLR
jgi:alanyl-tRNA synthetase